MTAMVKRDTRVTRMWLLCLIAAAWANTAWADVRQCDCTAENQANWSTKKECSLCLVAEKMPAYVGVFFLKDANPTKQNRILVLPRKHYRGGHPLHEMAKQERLLLWTAAIAKAEEVWGNDWGIAYNGEERRTQFHTHLHIGKLLPDQETSGFLVVSGPAEIPAPEHTGLWIHPVNGKLHVHQGQQVNETVLMR